MMWLSVQESGQVVHVGGKVVIKMYTNYALQVVQDWKLTWDIEFISIPVEHTNTLELKQCWHGSFQFCTLMSELY